MGEDFVVVNENGQELVFVKFPDGDPRANGPKPCLRTSLAYALSQGYEQCNPTIQEIAPVKKTKGRK